MSSNNNNEDEFVFQMPESFWSKGLRKCRENPLVPVGVLVTTGFLTAGFVAFKKGQKQRMQIMMRGRVLAQTFTLIVIAGTYFLGLYFSAKIIYFVI